MKHLLPLLAFGLLAASTSAQDHSTPFQCHTGGAEFNATLHGNDPVLMQAMADEAEALEEQTRAFAEGGELRSNYVVPVVFHIIHNGGAENISDAQVIDAMRILNEDFNRENSDWQNVKAEFLGIVADVSIEFRLARKDPNGNCTNGITRTVSTLTYQGDQSMKNLIQWPRNRYLNIWVGASANGAAGYALLPSAAQFLSTQDGIVLQHTYVGSTGTGIPQRSRALTHEVGHWINLAHTWGNSNNPALASNCNEDDGVSDTPNTIGWTTCNLNGATCPNSQGIAQLDNVENFMDYSYCSKMFTNGQKTRMIASLTSTTAQRNQLHQASNLTFTGVEGAPQLCAALFNSTSRSVCSGASITFNDVSYHGVATRTWNFEGGTPATSTVPNPTVTYSQPGNYAVTLTMSDGTNSLTNNATSFITVLPSTGAPVPLIDGFEGYSDLANSPWSVSGLGSNSFTLTSAAAFSGSKSVRMVNTSSMAGQINELVSSTHNMNGVSGINISFRYAFAKRSTANDDRLRFFVSNDCGQTWSLRQQLRGSTNLSTAPNTTASFVPNGGDQWGFTEITNISNAYHVGNFRFKFEFESDGGNNVYIDDININGAAVGIDDLLGAGNAMVVVPNPAAQEARVMLDLKQAGAVRLELLDVLGRSIHVFHDGNMAQGRHQVEVPMGQLHSGMYFIRLQQGSLVRVERFVVE
ncbi:MAG: M43 family zinc metalloprotease [Flavobacteriales bacterium]